MEKLSSKGNVDAHLSRLWEYWGGFRSEVLGTSPNRAHLAIAAVQAAFPDSTTVITQNIDGLHNAALAYVTGEGSHAGAPGSGVFELHGNVFRARCVASTRGGAGCEAKASVEDLEVRTEAGVCVTCGGPTRPDVVLFGERLDKQLFTWARSAAQAADVFVAVGTSQVVHPAAEIPVFAARRPRRVLIDPVPSQTRLFTDVVREDAVVAVPRLVEELTGITVP